MADRPLRSLLLGLLNRLRPPRSFYHRLLREARVRGNLNLPRPRR